MLSLEQMQTLMLVAEAEDPIEAAHRLRDKWRYLLGLALAAQKGLSLDDRYPQVMLEPDRYATSARSILETLESWLQEHDRRRVSDRT